jgi:hypothetical protein
MGVWHGVAMDSLKYHYGPTPLSPAGGPPLKRPYWHFRGGSPTGQAACGRPLPPWTPHVVRLWIKLFCVHSAMKPALPQNRLDSYKSSGHMYSSFLLEEGFFQCTCDQSLRRKTGFEMQRKCTEKQIPNLKSYLSGALFFPPSIKSHLPTYLPMHPPAICLSAFDHNPTTCESTHRLHWFLDSS